jgi:hypothetical protein
MSRRKKIDVPDHARRNFMKWTLGLGAALGLKPWKIFESTESIFGTALADGAACSPVARFVGLVAGNGGLAWGTQLWPHADQATQSGGAFYATGQAVDQVMASGDHPMKLSPAAPAWGKMTAFMAGQNETHTNRPTSSSTIGTGTGLFAAVAALQTASPTLVPAIGIGMLPYGTATGAPALAAVPNAAGLVDLFNSAASSAGGALANSGDASLFEAYYKANIGLLRAAQRPTMQRGLGIGKVSSNLIGKNLANQLRPTADDLARYGVDAGTPQKLSSIANALITTVKAWKLNLTSSVIMPAFLDDPHGAFNDMAGTTATVQGFGAILTAFYNDLKATPDPSCGGLTLADNFVFAMTGDTPKDPNNPSGWPDGTPGNSNWLYVRGNGWLKSGWFGQVKGDGSIETWDPTSGNNMSGGSTDTLSGPAGAAVLYAVAKGDSRRVQDFYRGTIDGVTQPKQM